MSKGSTKMQATIAPSENKAEDDMSDAPKILVVDDESNILDVVELYLLREGFRVVRAADGVTALDLFTQQTPDVVVLDIMLPQMDGLEVLQRIRQRANRPTPVILLTAKGQEEDKLAGLDGGADDYLTKPFSPRELVARVKVALRRMQEAQKVSTSQPLAPQGQEEALRFEDLYINKTARQVRAYNRPVELTAKEFDLLWFLASNAGQVFSREQLLDKVWDYSFFGEMSTVTVHVRRLREKIEADPMRPRFIKTVWGVGYKFES
jgi:two-component system, OmpR family, response regulator VicR